MNQIAQNDSTQNRNVFQLNADKVNKDKEYWPTGNHRQFGRQLDPIGIIQAILEKKWLILLTALLITLVAALFVSLIAPTYKATATIEIGIKPKNLITFDEQKDDIRAETNLLQTQIESLRSRVLAKRVIDKLGLNQINEFLPEEINRSKNNGKTMGSLNAQNQLEQSTFDNQVITLFLEKLTVKQIDFTRLIEISYESKSATLASNIANAIAEQYIESLVERRNELSNQAVDSISLRLSSLKSNLDASEKKLLEFKLVNNIIDVDGAAGRLNEQEILLSSSELVTAKSNLLQISNLRSEIKKLENSPTLLGSLPQIQSDPLIRQARLDLDNERRKLRELSNKYGFKHPKIVDANSRITSLENSLQAYTRQITNRIENEYQQMVNKVYLLESKLQAGKSSIQDLGAKKIELNTLQNEVVTNREIYNTFFNRLLESNSVQGLELNHAEVVESAYQPTEPNKPKKKVIVLLAMLGALLLSCLLTVALRVFDDTIHNSRDIEVRTGLKLLGIIPDTRVQKSSKFMPWTRKVNNDHTESINILNANIRMIDKRGPNKLIMITSSAPNEGKTTSGLALAVAMSKTENVLLVDADLRKGTLSRALGIDIEKPGLTNLVLGEVKPKDIIQRDAVKNFSFISCGSTTDQPLAILSSKAFERVLSELAFVYDRVIIDCPPVLAVSDAKVVSELADSVLYLIRAKKTPSKLVEHGLNALRESKARIIGAVVTQVNMKSMRKFGGVYDFHGFHDYYGYTQSTNRGKVINLDRSDIERLNEDDSPVISRKLNS